jgi:hypothetical protein
VNKAWKRNGQFLEAGLCPPTGDVAIAQQRRRYSVQPNRLRGDLGETAPLYQSADRGHREWITEDAPERVGETVGMLGEQGQRNGFGCQPHRQAQQQQRRLYSTLVKTIK